MRTAFFWVITQRVVVVIVVAAEVVVMVVVVVVVEISYRRFGTTYRSHMQGWLSRNFGKKTISATCCIITQKGAVLKR